MKLILIKYIKISYFFLILLLKVNSLKINTKNNTFINKYLINVINFYFINLYNDVTSFNPNPNIALTSLIILIFYAVSIADNSTSK
jgi:hypothetical protein